MGASKKDFENALAIHPTYAEELINVKSVKGKDELTTSGC